MFERVLNTPGFWIYHSSEYASDFEYARVLNMPGLHRVLNANESLNMPDYAWLCLNMPELAGICVNISKSA